MLRSCCLQGEICCSSLYSTPRSFSSCPTNDEGESLMKRRKAGKISHGLWHTWSHLVRFPGHLSQLHVFHAGFQETPCFISKDRALHSRNHRRSPVGRDPKGTLGPVPPPHSTPSPVSSGVPALPLTARGCAHCPGELCHAHRPLGHSLSLALP